MDVDVIGGFPERSDNCKGCGNPLLLGNAWMTDGCPCNSPLGVNSMNETRWRLLMQLQQIQSREIETLKHHYEMLRLQIPPGNEVSLNGVVQNAK